MSKWVLVVDDSRVARMALRKGLLAQDCTVEECDSAEQAIDWLQNHERQPDVIFMDVMMPGMDGLTATQKIKADPRFATIPIVVCTGNDSEVDQDNALKAGAIAVMTKPPKAEQVDSIFAALSNMNNEEEIAPQPEAMVVEQTDMAHQVIEEVEQNLISQLNQQAHDIAEKIATEICQDYAKRHASALTQQVDMLKTNLSQQVQANTEQQLTRSIEQQKTTVEDQVRAVMDSVLSDIDVMQQVKHDIAVQTAPWLEQQQRQLQVELGMQIGPKVTAAVEQHLKDRLTAMVSPLVAERVDKHWAQLNANLKTDIEPEPEQNELADLTQRLSRLQQWMFVLTIGLLAVTVLHFI